METIRLFMLENWFLSYLVSTISSVLVLSSVINHEYEDTGCLAYMYNFACISLAAFTWILWLPVCMHFTESHLFTCLHHIIIYPIVIVLEMLGLEWINNKLNQSSWWYLPLRIIITLIAATVIIGMYISLAEFDDESFKRALENMEYVLE